MNKITVITSSRSDYGLLKWIMSAIQASPELKLQIIATGGHLSLEQGLTYTYIEKDGFIIDETIEMLLSSNTSSAIVKSMGVCTLALADCFKRLQPDLVVVLGDRYELLPICSTALVMGIPIAHLSGGDVTEGAIDNEVRNAITMMATLHFPGVKDSARSIIRMCNSSKNVFTVGEPGLENFKRMEIMPKTELAEDLHLDIHRKWILVTYHPETKVTVEENLMIAQRMMNRLCHAFPKAEIVITKSNADLGGMQLNELWQKYADKEAFVSLFSSLGQARYCSFMQYASLVVGNLSSGIVEAPYYGVPVVNIGNRQKGRHLCANIRQTEGTEKALEEAFMQIKKGFKEAHRIPDYYWGDGDTSRRVVCHLVNYLKSLAV